MLSRFQFAPDTGGSPEPFLPEIEDPNAQLFGEREVSAADEEVEYVVEGSEEAQRLAANGGEPEEFRGKSREDLLAEIAKNREAMVSQTKAAEPVSALQQTMAQMLGQMKPQEAPVRPGYSVVPQAQNQMSDADFEKHINELMLENPYKAQQEVQARVMSPLLQTMAVNQAQLSRELALTHPETKKVYDKYSREIEEYVAQQPVQVRLQNPRVYQSAVEAVKARHMDEFVSEEFDKKLNDALNAKLAELGIDPNAKAAPKPGYVAPSSVAARPATPAAPNKRTVAIPRWVKEEADKRGMDPGFYFEHLKSKGYKV